MISNNNNKTMDDRQRKIDVQKVLQEELKSLKKNAKVYKQQQNSNIFFRANRDKVFEECKRTMDDLVMEYKGAEGATQTPGDLGERDKG